MDSEIPFKTIDCVFLVPEEYREDCKTISFYLYNKFIDVSLLEAYNLWSNFSDSYCAGWLIVCEESLKDFFWYVKSEGYIRR